MHLKLLSGYGVFRAEHRAELIVQKLGLFLGVGEQLSCIFQRRDSHFLCSSCLDEAPERLAGGW